MKLFYLLIFQAIILFPATSWAAFFANHPAKVSQPDGSTIHCYISGDEHFNWLHDSNGYTIIQAEDGFYYFATSEKGKLMASQLRADQGDPASFNLQTNLKISKEQYLLNRQTTEVSVSRSNTAVHQGKMNNLAIYIRFSDDAEFQTSRQEFNNLFNGVQNSVNSYFREVSYQKLDISTTHYPDCTPQLNLSFQASQPRAYYEPYNATTNQQGYQNETERRLREHGLLRDAINWINIHSPIPQNLVIDEDGDGDVDNISFVTKGNNSSWGGLLWAHRWSLYTYDVQINGKKVTDYTLQPENQCNVTTLCHEIFHVLGAPDLYHYNQTGNNISPVHVWDLMASGSGHMGAYMKWKYSNQTWIESIPAITVSGTYTLNPLTSGENNAFMIASPNSQNEFFVIEYRKQESSLENNLPGTGLIIYRINPAYRGNAAGPPDEVYIYRPGGSETENGFPEQAFFSAESGRTQFNENSNPRSFLPGGNETGLNIYNISESGSTITFSVEFEESHLPGYFMVTDFGANQINLTWNASENQQYLLAYSKEITFGAPENGSTYTAGQPLNGGGIVLHFSAANGFCHQNLNPGTTYHYKIWTLDEAGNYLQANSLSHSTACGINQLPYSENFSTGRFPDCWSEQFEGENAASSWEFQQSSLAGGSAGEMRTHWQQANPAITRLIMPPFDTRGAIELELSFNHFLDAYSAGAELKIQSSSDGISWTDETWKVQTSNCNIGAECVTTQIKNNLNQAETYIAFVVSGNLYKYDFWYIDNVNVSVSQSMFYLLNLQCNNQSAGVVNGCGQYSPGETVSISAIAHPGYLFISWAENDMVVSEDEVYTLNMNSNRNLNATFVKAFDINSQSASPEMGSTEGNGIYPEGSRVMLRAEANSGYLFKGWAENNEIISLSTELTFIANQSRNLTALFESNVGISEIKTSDMQIYPNPTHGNISIESDDLNNTLGFELLSSSGATVRFFANNPSGNKISLDLSGYIPGIYFIREIKRKGSVSVKKLIIF